MGLTFEQIEKQFNLKKERSIFGVTKKVVEEFGMIYFDLIGPDGNLFQKEVGKISSMELPAEKKNHVVKFPSGFQWEEDAAIILFKIESGVTKEVFRKAFKDPMQQSTLFSTPPIAAGLDPSQLVKDILATFPKQADFLKLEANGTVGANCFVAKVLEAYAAKQQQQQQQQQQQPDPQQQLDPQQQQQQQPVANKWNNIPWGALIALFMILAFIVLVIKM